MKIVAPAGNMERFYSAIKAGAKEIYMGLKGYGARRNAENFTLEEYKYAIDYAHQRGVKVFLTLNTIMMENEMEFLYQNVKVLYEHGLDAIIVQDLGYFNFLKNNFPNIEYHGSTQMTVANHYEAQYLKNIGFTRIVLPREMSYEEIKNIRENTDIELEIFVSGALCICYSGNCYLSSFIGSRSGNRGMCAQPCRKKYELSSGEKGFFISPKDQLLGYEEIQKLKNIGIESIKLEGRMKDPKYVFETVSYYKNCIEGIKREEKSSSIFNRGYSQGYFYGADKTLINKDYSSSLGKNLGVLNGKELKLFDSVVLGDGITFLSENYEKIGGSYINKIEIKNKGKEHKKAMTGDTIILKEIPKETKYIYKSYAKEIYDEVEHKLKQYEQKLKIIGKFYAKIGKNPILTFECINNLNKKITVSKSGDFFVEKANKKALTSEDIKEKISELGDTTFSLVEFSSEIDENIFIPLSELKNLKREVTVLLEEKLIESYRKKALERYYIEKEEEKTREITLVAITTNDRQKEVLEELGVKKIYKKGYDVAREGQLPMHNLNSKLASNLYQILENKNNDVLVNWNLNITNRYTIIELEKIGKIESVMISPELSFEKIKNIGKVNVKKAILGYSKLKGMHIELPLFNKDKEILLNAEGDNFIAVKNKLNNTEIYLEKPLNILNDIDKLNDLYIDEVVLEFSDETPEDIRKIFDDMRKKKSFYKAYNYERGVY